MTPSRSPVPRCRPQQRWRRHRQSGTLTGSNSITVGNVTTFQGGITNTQKITAASDGIFIGSTGSVSGAIVNSAGATISGGLVGIAINSVVNFGSTSAGGGISNAGTLSGTTGIKITGNVVFAAGTAIVNTGNITDRRHRYYRRRRREFGHHRSECRHHYRQRFAVIARRRDDDRRRHRHRQHHRRRIERHTEFLAGVERDLYRQHTFTTINQVNINSGTVLLDGGTDDANAVDVFSVPRLAGAGRRSIRLV